MTKGRILEIVRAIKIIAEEDCNQAKNIHISLPPQETIIFLTSQILEGEDKAPIKEQ